MSTLLIRNARIARPDGTLLDGDLLCDNGSIARIDAALDIEGDQSIDARGMLLLPGIIDAHVHFREPGHEYKEDLFSGSRAAAKGGVTSFLEMPNTDPPTVSRQALRDKLARAASRSTVNYGFFIGATPNNLDELNAAREACGIKIFMGCSTGGLLVDRDEDLERIFAGCDRLIAVHAEDETRLNQRQRALVERRDAAAHSEIRDPEAALIATRRAIDFARRYRRRLHILHLSTAAEVELMRRDNPEGIKAEVSPNHLFLNVGDYARSGTRVQMNPPIRTPADNAALWAGLRDGVLDFIGSDHAPHTLAEKDRPFPEAPSGMPGVETTLPLMLTEMAAGRCSLAQILQWMCAGPAQAYGLAHKGLIQEGYDADLTLVDVESVRPVRHEEMISKCRWSPYHGRELTGWPVYTVVGGEIAFERGRIRGEVRGRALRFRR